MVVRNMHKDDIGFGFPFATKRKICSWQKMASNFGGFTITVTRDNQYIDNIQDIYNLSAINSTDYK